MSSLALRLSAAIIAVFVPMQILIGVATYAHAERRSSTLVDRLLEQQADAIADVATLGSGDSAATIPSARPVPASRSNGFQLWSGDNRLLASTPAFAKLALDAAPAGLSDLVLEGHRWRVLTSLSHERWIRVGQRHEVEDAAVRAIALQMIAFVLLGIPLMLLAMRVVLGRCLAPVDALAEQIDRCELGEAAPIGPGELPREFEPIVASVNHLLLKCGRGERSMPRALEATRCESNRT